MSYDEDIERILDAITWEEAAKVLPTVVVTAKYEKDKPKAIKQEQEKGD